MQTLNDDVVNLLACTEIATLLVDRPGTIRRFTPGAARIFGLAAGDIGRAITDVLGAPLAQGLAASVDKVMSGETLQDEIQIETASGQSYVRRITPYIAVRGTSPTGAVVTWTDITHARAADVRILNQRREAARSFDAVTVFDLKGHLIAWNRAATAMYGYSEADALRMSVSDMVPRGARQGVMPPAWRRQSVRSTIAA